MSLRVVTPTAALAAAGAGVQITSASSLPSSVPVNQQFNFSVTGQVVNGNVTNPAVGLYYYSGPSDYIIIVTQSGTIQLSKGTAVVAYIQGTESAWHNGHSTGRCNTPNARHVHSATCCRLRKRQRYDSHRLQDLHRERHGNRCSPITWCHGAQPAVVGSLCHSSCNCWRYWYRSGWLDVPAAANDGSSLG